MAEILVCDDDKDIVEAIEIYLTQEGYHILKAYDGEQAIQVLQNNKVDLLIIDVMMPKLDGIRATLKIREKNVLPIIILSTKSEDADKILGLNVGADDYVTKPFNPLELVSRVKSQLRSWVRWQKKRRMFTGPAGLRLMMTVKKLRLMAMLSNSHRSNTGFFFFCYRIRAEFFLSIRYMRVSGKKKRLLRTIRLLSISVISGRR